MQILIYSNWFYLLQMFVIWLWISRFNCKESLMRILNILRDNVICKLVKKSTSILKEKRRRKIDCQVHQEIKTISNTFDIIAHTWSIYDAIKHHLLAIEKEVFKYIHSFDRVGSEHTRTHSHTCSHIRGMLQRKIKQWIRDKHFDGIGDSCKRPAMQQERFN